MKVAPLLVLSTAAGCGIGVGGVTTVMRTTDPVANTDPDGTARMTATGDYERTTDLVSPVPWTITLGVRAFL